MKAIHALCAIALAGAALVGGDPSALAQNTATTVAVPAPQSRGGTYMKIEGMPGAATDKLHPGWIEISSFQWGIGRGISSGTGSAADRQGQAPSVSEITVTKQQDASSSKLMQAATLAKHFPEVTIEFVRPDKQVVYQVRLKDVVISRHAMSSGGDRPSESVTLNFTKIEWTYSNQKPDGTTGTPQTPPAGWDLAQVTKV